MSHTTEILKKSHVTPWQEMDGQVLVLMPKQNTVHELNTTASFLWKNIDGTRTISDLAQLIAEEFEITPPEAANDIQIFASEMKKQGLLIE